MVPFPKPEGSLVPSMFVAEQGIVLWSTEPGPKARGDHHGRLSAMPLGYSTAQPQIK